MNDPAPPSRQQRALETRDRLFLAACDLFVANGYAGTTVDSIASRAGVAKGTFFVHFKTKDAVATQLIEIDGLELGGVVEALIHRVRDGRVLAQDREVDLVRPPGAVSHALGRVVRTADDRAHGFGTVLVHLADDGVRLIRHGIPSGSGAELRSGGGRTLGAQPPVDDLRLIDRETAVVRSGEAGSRADGAVDVGDRAAGATHEVVVVVRDA